MKDLEKQLEDKIKSMAGNGFGDLSAAAHHNQEIELLKHKISQRNQIRFAILGALVGSLSTLGLQMVSHLL